jgi:CubicO group peptidase (beta-lactamase class C family)
MQRDIQRLLDNAVAQGAEHAVQVAAYLDGERIVDAWAAPAGWTIDGASLFPIFSTGKGFAATAVHRLVERGVLAWDAPIAHYWPEFAAHGKGGITLRHALDHTAGLPMMPERGTMAEAADWDGMCRYLANATPIHAPGARRHYHAITYSWLVGETARRADGRDFGRIIAEEVCQPLGIADEVFFGLPDSVLARVVDAEPAPPPAATPAAQPVPQAPPDPVAARAVPSWVCPLETWINSASVRRGCVPASNGFMTARAIACHYASLVGQGVGGVRLLSEATMDAATAWHPIPRVDLVGCGRRGLGYGLQGPDDDPGAVFGHGGYGGSNGFADRRQRLAIGFTRSLMGGPSVQEEVVQTIRRLAGTA